MAPGGFRRLFRFTRRSRREIVRDVHEEFMFHLDMRVADLEAQGLPAEAARAQAAREFGDRRAGAAACAREDAAAEHRRGLARILADFRQDVVFAARLAGRTPGFSAVVVLTLGVAIGGNTAIFSAVNALVIKPLPVRAPDEVVRIYPGQSTMSWPNLQDFRARTKAFSQVFAQRATLPAFDAGAGPVRLTGTAVTPEYFPALGVGPIVGRVFTPADARTDVAVLSERAWRAHFAAAPDVAGRIVRIDGRAVEILGVMPRSFRGVAPPGLPRDVWTPLDFSGDVRRFERDREATGFEVFGRLRQGTTLAEATPDVRLAGAELAAAYPDINRRFADIRLIPVSGLRGFQGMSVLMPIVAFLALLAVIASLVLLVGCANIAGLMLGRAAFRRREIAVRLSLGAARGRLVRQFLTESLLLALAGGVLGVALSAWLTGLVPLATRSLPFPVEFDLAVDGRVLAYALLLACGAAILCGLAPARQAARTNLVEALKLDSGGAGRQRLRTALVVGQIAVCTALLVWGGLFARSLANAGQVDPGFVADGVLLVELPIGEIAGPDPAARARAAQHLHERIGSLPDVESTGMAFAVPLSLSARAEYEIRIPVEGGEPRIARVMGNTVTPGYFDTIRVRRRAGRDFDWRDGRGSSRVVIVNETAARRFWNGHAVGQRIELTDGDRWTWAEVVGVVADSKYWTVGEEIAPTVYQAYGQAMSGNTMFVRTTAPARAREAIANELRRVAPQQPVEIRPMTEAVAISTMPARVGALATTAFGVLAMLLSAMGIYGMVAFSVAQRAREIGVRKALGATSGAIVGHVLRGSLSRSTVALVVGAGGGSLAASLFGGFIVGISNFDVATLTAVSALVLGATAVASLPPAARAARIDPVTTLRAD